MGGRAMTRNSANDPFADASKALFWILTSDFAKASIAAG